MSIFEEPVSDWQFKNAGVMKVVGKTLALGQIKGGIVGKMMCIFKRKWSACYNCPGCCFSSGIPSTKRMENLPEYGFLETYPNKSGNILVAMEAVFEIKIKIPKFTKVKIFKKTYSWLLKKDRPEGRKYCIKMLRTISNPVKKGVGNFSILKREDAPGSTRCNP